jgi:hypothetical protein
MSLPRVQLGAAILGLLAVGALAVEGCSLDPGASTGGGDRCSQVIAAMAACYPDLATEGRCSESTVAEFDRLDLGSKDCDTIDDVGKADWFAAGGCDAGQHVCDWIFCCDDYVITWRPSSAEDWNVTPVIDALGAALPDEVASAAAEASWEQLRGGVSWHYQQQVAERVGGAPKDLAVEYTQQLVEVPYEDFSAVLPAQSWGVELAHYLGGQVEVYEQDAQGRATAQLERMVLSPVPCDWESPLSNNDMTKVEIIEREPDRARVSWRVMYSNNDSTVTDVGSVEFAAYGSTATLITFHSAHKLNAPGGIPIPLAILGPALSYTVLDFTRHYAEIVSTYR